MSKVMIFLQARMGSSRLPGKTLMSIRGKPMIAYCLDRLSLVDGITKDQIVLVTSVNAVDDQLVAWCHENNVQVFRGSEQNVLERYFLAMEKYKPGHIVRATGDNPFVDPYYASSLLKFHIEGAFDYSSNKSEVGFFLPDGVGVEIFSAQCLRSVYEKSTLPHHFEHINEYILENPGQFRVGVPSVNELTADLSKVRLTVDTELDFQKASRIINSQDFNIELKLPELLSLV